MLLSPIKSSVCQNDTKRSHKEQDLFQSVFRLYLLPHVFLSFLEEPGKTMRLEVCQIWVLSDEGSIICQIKGFLEEI